MSEPSRFLFDSDLYENFLIQAIPACKKSLKIATADIKDMHVKLKGRVAPFLKLLSELIGAGVKVELLHAKEPGPIFRRDFDRYPNLYETDGLKRQLCPRVHFKIIIIDGRTAYSGSANLTGAGLGMKHADKRNFEWGYITKNPREIGQLAARFDAVIAGRHCKSCRLRSVCPDPVL